MTFVSTSQHLSTLFCNLAFIYIYWLNHDQQMINKMAPVRILCDIRRNVLFCQHHQNLCLMVLTNVILVSIFSILMLVIPISHQEYHFLCIFVASAVSCVKLNLAVTYSSVREYV